MKQFAKDILGDIRKAVVTLLVGALSVLLVSGGATAKWWGELLSIQDTKISSIQHWLWLGAAICLAIAGWFLYVRTFRRLQTVEKQVMDLLAHPRKVADDYEADPDFPKLYRHKERKAGKVCPRCLFSFDRAVPIQITDERWISCVAKDCKFVIEHPKHKVAVEVYRMGGG